MATASLDPEAVTALIGRTRHEVATGRVPACQIAIGLDGDVVLDETFGAPADTRFAWFSTTKPLVAGAVWRLLGDALELSTPVVQLFPEFAANGKAAVTVEHLLLHTAGFPRAPLGPDIWHERDARRTRMASWRLDTAPGTACNYHATSAHWVLAELLEIITGRDFRDAVADLVTAPLGLPRVLGIPVAEQEGILDLVVVGEALAAEEFTRLTGMAADGPVAVADAETRLRYNSAAHRSAGVPGGGGYGRAADLARFYQGLLHDTAGLFDPAVLADVTGHVRTRLVDGARGIPANRTAGLLVAGDDGHARSRGFGSATSARAFGHDGLGGQMAWADPATGLSFAFLTNAVDRDPVREAMRPIGIANRAAVCAR